MSRVTCPRCRRPEPRCICAIARPIANRIGVTVLQHPGERHHPFNTARLARAVLRNSALHVLWPDADGQFVHAGPIREGAALLYPHPSAVDLEGLPEAERPAHLVVIDGTWSQARAVYRDNPWLAALPHVRLHPNAPSRYRVRREPAADHVSTIEALAFALAVLEPDTAGIDHLLDGFLALVSAEDARAATASPRRRRRGRLGGAARLAADWDRVVVGYAEGLDRLTLWAAARPSTGDTFEARLGPGRSATDQGFAAAWAAFAGPDAVVACWSPRAGALLADAIGWAPELVCLRAAYGNLRAGSGGRLDEVVAREGWPVLSVAVPGRAGERLANATAVARFVAGGSRRR